MRDITAIVGPGVASPASHPRGLIGVDRPEARLSPITSPDAFEALWQESQDLLCVRDLRGKLIRLNPSWSTMLGFPERHLHGAPLLDFVHPQDVWATHDVMHGVSGDQMVLGFSNRYRMLDGGHRRFEWTARRFGDYVFGIGCKIAG